MEVSRKLPYNPALMAQWGHRDNLVPRVMWDLQDAQERTELQVVTVATVILALRESLLKRL